MKAILLILALGLSACAPKNGASDQASAPTPAPGQATPTPPVTSSIWCGELVTSTMGMAFRTNLITGDTFKLDEGIRDIPASCNGWGSCTPECKYEIKNGIPGAVQDSN